MNFQKTDIKPSHFSSYLFWDIAVDSLDWDTSAPLIVERVLQLGQLEDWNLLKSYYGIDKILELAKKLNSLDDVTINFLCTIFEQKKEDFKCYTRRQSSPHFWNY
ncbi:DUF6922 domain-containing protein [Belliella pelovolcani]|uniref:DUF6922 domain-containing protein n=1 Tax=Belliella pelovolcani TaxID=529505 RepID=A0A1N7MEV2_9BACT|nr:hypothetical protein [Belliella pelovolcani]SIS84656.1 hypothetical protein SAMN05421761_10629 [Belliella pelovolcani]